jgi:hypothetical protein
MFMDLNFGFKSFTDRFPNENVYNEEYVIRSARPCGHGQ